VEEAITLIASIIPLIPDHLVRLLGGPEKAGVGGSIPSRRPFRINKLGFFPRSIRKAEDSSIHANSTAFSDL
jgi:hypothetical protein